MKGKQLAILLLVVVVLGGLWYLLGSRRNGSSWSETGGGGGKVVNFPLNDVAQIVIKSPTGDLHLVKTADVWTVKERADYPANFEGVSDFLRKLWELKRVQVLKVGPSQLPRLELVEPGKGDKAGTLVQLLGADGKTLDAVILGKKYLRKSEGGGEMDMGMGGMDAGGSPAGRYVKRAEGETVALVSQTLDDADPKPERWLSKDFVKVDGPKSVAVAGPTDTQKWSISRENAAAEWKLIDAKGDEKLDPTKVSALNTVFASPAFSDVLAPDAKLEEPVTPATIETFEGFRYDLKIGKPTNDNYPVTVKVSANLPKERPPGKDEKPEDKTRLDNEFATKRQQLEEKLAKEQKAEGRTYLVAKYVVEGIVKDRDGYLALKPTPTPTPVPAPGPAAAIPPVPVPIPAPPALVTPFPTAPPATPALVAPAPTDAGASSPAAAPPITVTTAPVSAPTPTPTPMPSVPAAPPVEPAPSPK